MYKVNTELFLSAYLTSLLEHLSPFSFCPYKNSVSSLPVAEVSNFSRIINSSFFYTPPLKPQWIKMLFKDIKNRIPFYLIDSDCPWCKPPLLGPGILHSTPHQTLLPPLYFLPNFAEFFFTEAKRKILKCKSCQHCTFIPKCLSFPINERNPTSIACTTYHARHHLSLLTLISHNSSCPWPSHYPSNAARP